MKSEIANMFLLSKFSAFCFCLFVVLFLREREGSFFKCVNESACTWKTRILLRFRIGRIIN